VVPACKLTTVGVNYQINLGCGRWPVGQMRINRRNKSTVATSWVAAKPSKPQK
jgi:hypothetical protein